MKINSEKLFDFVNNLGTNEKVKFKVFEDDNYVTEIYWDGENFNWESGTFTSGMLFNPLVDFVEIEEEKEIPEKLPYYSMEKIQKAKNKDEWREERISLLEKRVDDLHIKMNDLLDYLKSKGDE